MGERWDEVSISNTSLVVVREEQDFRPKSMEPLYSTDSKVCQGRQSRKGLVKLQRLALNASSTSSVSEANYRPMAYNTPADPPI